MNKLPTSLGHIPDKAMRNSARCLICNTEIESKHTHDFKTCSCGNLSVDGGPSYLRRAYRGGEDTWEDTSQEFVQSDKKETNHDH